MAIDSRYKKFDHEIGMLGPIYQFRVKDPSTGNLGCVQTRTVIRAA